MAKILNTGDALYAALSHIFLVDDDNTIKELKAGLTCTPHANVLLPGTGSSTSPVGRSFRTGGAAGSSPAVYGVDHPNYVASNGASISLFVAVNQFNSANGVTPGAGAMLFSTDSPGIKVGTGIQIDPATGQAYNHNNNGGTTVSATLNTAGSITAGGVKSFGFTRTAAGVVKFFINGVVDTAYAGGVANTGSQFGAAWTTAEQSLIGGMAANSWVSFDYAYICDFLGTIVSEAEMLRLHNSLTGSDAFALITLPADTTPPTLTSPTCSNTGSTTASGTVTTNEAGGTLYRLASANATESAATVKAAALTQSVTAVGSQAFAFTGLTASTSYYAHCVHRDAAGNDSLVASTAQFTTAAAGDTVAPVITGAITVVPLSITTTGWQADWNAATDNSGSVTYDISTDGGTTWPINWPISNYTYDGYTPGTTYALRVRARDAAGNLSSVISGTVTTLSVVFATAITFTIAGAVSLTGLKYAVFEGVTPDLWVAPIRKGANASTNSGAVCTLSVAGSTTKQAGELGTVIVTNSDGTATGGAQAATRRASYYTGVFS